MGATGEFLARAPRRSDGKWDWPPELKARIVTAIAGGHKQSDINDVLPWNYAKPL